MNSYANKKTTLMALAAAMLMVLAAAAVLSTGVFAEDADVVDEEPVEDVTNVAKIGATEYATLAAAFEAAADGDRIVLL
ncbi:MAG: hypothetical protein IJ856_02445, partial [Candidatus Methanomethylophilaceae archaeon]|nr:hypothetical protein [Candidatus Methanomethylophilaceae archaeon]